ncbi:MAG TPA: hypothetical protein VFE37_17385 [Chloroflexota bacterium]|nr:hypothetical protein [Chloroflexota bacterium]
MPPDQLTLSPWVFLVVGLLLAFAGRALVVLQINLLGALLGALAASAILAAVLAAGATPPPSVPLEALNLGALLLGAIVGWVLAGLLRRVAVFVLGAIVGSAAFVQAAAIWPDLLPAGVAWLVGAIVGGILLLALAGPLLKLGSAILGGLLVTSALAVLLPPDLAGAAPLAGLACAIVGAIVQLARR